MTLPRWLLFGRSKKRHNSLNLFSNISWLEIDLSSYLVKFTKGNFTSEEFKATQQSLCLKTSSGHGRDTLSPGPYRDASYTIALYGGEKTDEKLPEESDYLACIGFDSERDQILVKQIQGNPGKGETLKFFKWERMLLAILTDWAKQNGFNQIRVIQAKDSGWYRKEEEEREQRMFMHYDVTARRSGFSFDQSRGQYVKNLA
mgnify:CR=1 FL=1